MRVRVLCTHSQVRTKQGVRSTAHYWCDVAWGRPSKRNRSPLCACKPLSSGYPSNVGAAYLIETNARKSPDFAPRGRCPHCHPTRGRAHQHDRTFLSLRHAQLFAPTELSVRRRWSGRAASHAHTRRNLSSEPADLLNRYVSIRNLKRLNLLSFSDVTAMFDVQRSRNFPSRHSSPHTRVQMARR